MKQILVLCLCVAVAYGGLAPLRLAKTRGVPSSYLIKIKDKSLVDDVESEIVSRFHKARMPTPKVKNLRQFIPVLTLRIPPHLIDEVRSLDGVEFIEQDSLGELFSEQAYSPSWGVDRIDQRTGTDGYYTYNKDVQGKGVDIYVVDSGVQVDHADFGGRASLMFGGPDMLGHGTHCAGTAAGGIYGVAREATIHSVRICLNPYTCSKMMLLDGLYEIYTHGFNRVKGVVSMSIGYQASEIVDGGVQHLWDSGFTVSAAAGNYNADACLLSPQRIKDTITAGATDENDNRASFSSYGQCVDLFAPGVNILSTKWSEDSNTATELQSGTSMSCPHVSGAAALYIGKQNNPKLTPQEVKDEILQAATKDVVKDPQGSPNKLLYVNY